MERHEPGPRFSRVRARLFVSGMTVIPGQHAQEVGRGGLIDIDHGTGLDDGDQAGLDIHDMGHGFDLDGPHHARGGIGHEQDVHGLNLGDTPENELATVHLAQLLAEKALGIGHDQAGRSGEGLIDHILLGIVDLVGDVQHANVIGRNVGVGQDGIALAVLFRVGDADRVVDLIVEPDAVVDDGLVIDEVVAAARR